MAKDLDIFQQARRSSVKDESTNEHVMLHDAIPYQYTCDSIFWERSS
jgi:hypothetical protein